ncbi:actin-42a [Anaeramoeba flamelloides]|uniref:Actin-42a n=1 Tax=Anaeramoeba flamelloides TaxID=1746091 RepID=A0ABQ8YMY8_9EUKA|nr:actin-42a [Anaeramoeba flamelloides]
MKKTKAIVIDNGSEYTKAGFSGEDQPRSVFLTIVGRPRHVGIMVGNDQKAIYVGDEAQSKRGILAIKYPIEHGIVCNWNDMEAIWEHVFKKELSVDPEEHPVLLSEPPLNPKANREMLTQMMFETFNTPSMSLVSQALLSLYETGRTTGYVINIGSSVTSCVPIKEGHVLADASYPLDLGGRDLTRYLLKLLEEKGYCFSSSIPNRSLKEMKETLCYVSLDYEKELIKVSENNEPYEKKYELSSGIFLKLDRQRFGAPEPLFKPFLMGRQQDGIHKTTYNSINNCPKEIKNELFSNIVLSGGSSMFPGLDERLEMEITKFAPQNTKVKIIAPPERKYLSWIGGSILATLSKFQEMWISKEEYEEYGPTIIQKKCLN